MDLKEPAPEVEPKKDLKTPRTVNMRFVEEVPYTGAVGRLRIGDVVLTRGETVEVSPQVAAEIRTAFGGRYVIEEE